MDWLANRLNQTQQSSTMPAMVICKGRVDPSAAGSPKHRTGSGPSGIPGGRRVLPARLIRWALTTRVPVFQRRGECMYIPTSFRIDDPAKLSAFMAANSFATLVTSHEGVPFATHLPVRPFCRDGVCTTLVSHMARANPQWRHFSPDTEVLTIFTGPHAYISPAWYSKSGAVPTWNYAVTHVYGYPVLMDDQERVVAMLEETVTFYESAFAKPWPGILPVDLRDRLVRSIVAFEIGVTRIEGKFKLGQDRSVDDRNSVHDALAASPHQLDRELSELMAREGLVCRTGSPGDAGE